ncbi:MAG: anti-sigma factor domain-containing protein [Elainellaceae cyanobacterium]
MAQSLSNEEQALAAGYVLGDLTADEASQVAQLLNTNPAMQEEVEALRVSLQLVPLGLDMAAPPAHLEDKLMAAYQATEASEASEAADLNRSQGTTAPGSRSWARIIAALSIPALLLLAFGNLRMRQQFAQLEDENRQLQQQLAALEDTDEVASILQRPRSRLVALQGSRSAGTLLFTPGQWEQVVVSIADLPPLPPDQIYRMWLSLDNGQPFLCGEFTTDEQGSVFVTLNPPDAIPEGVKAQEVFVTQSDASAPLEPTGDRVIVGEI